MFVNNIDFTLLTSVIYGLLVLIWGLILALYINKLMFIRKSSKTISILLFILALDAFRTLIESAYFGLYFSSSDQLIANNIIFQPAIFIFPKLLNVAVALLIIFILIKYWIPKFITDDSNIKNQLNDSELRFNVAVKYSPNPIIIHVEDGEVLAISDKLIELTDYSREELTTIKNWTNKAYKYNPKKMYKKILDGYKKDIGINFGEVLVYGKDDKELYWDINSISLGHLSDGRKARMMTSIDVTYQKTMLNKLYLIEHSINQITDSVIWFSEQGNIVNHNTFAEMQFGFSSEAFSELNINALQLNIAMPWQELWTKTTVNKSINFQSSITTNSGENVPVNVSAHYLEFNHHQYVFMIIRDASAEIAAEKAILESEQRRKFALDAANIGDWDMDIKTNIARRSLIHDQCFGYAESVEDWGYEKFISHVHPLDRERVVSVYKEAKDGGSLYDVEFRVTWPDNTIHWLWSKGRFYFDDSGKSIRVSGIQVDITQRKYKEMALRLNNSAIEAATVGIVIVDALQRDMPMVYINPAFEKITGYNESDILGKNCRFLNTSVRDEEKLIKIREALAIGSDVEVELINKRKDGSTFWNLLKISPVFDEGGQVTHFVGIQMDITERKNAESQNELLNEEIRSLAFYDTLTGLPNRASLNRHLEAFNHLSNMPKMSHAILLMDVDNFKNINDAFGHYIGDLFIKEFANRLKKNIDSGSFLCRFGGDGFILVISDEIQHTEKLFKSAKDVADKLLLGMRLPFRLKELDFFSSVSIGIKFVDSDLNIIDAIKQADLAMYQAKRIGKNNIQIFDEVLEKKVLYRSKLESHLRNAIENNEFELYYQPQINSHHKVFGCEVLIRWLSPDLGHYVSPADFIPVAEETALILPIGEWVLVNACKTLNSWHEIEAFKDITLSINISAIQFKNSHFISTLKNTLQNYSFDKKNLKLELTETMLADEVDSVILAMHQIKRMGLSISLDDFGTGYSSLSYLKAFPIDQLKIDQSFVRDILIDHNDASIAEAIIKLSRTLGFETIAEGVETEEQKSFLIELGCNQFQGYLYSKAVSLEDVERYIKQFNI